MKYYKKYHPYHLFLSCFSDAWEHFEKITNIKIWVKHEDESGIHCVLRERRLTGSGKIWHNPFALLHFDPERKDFILDRKHEQFGTNLLVPPPTQETFDNYEELKKEYFESVIMPKQIERIERIKQEMDEREWISEIDKEEI